MTDGARRHMSLPVQHSPDAKSLATSDIDPEEGFCQSHLDRILHHDGVIAIVSPKLAKCGPGCRG